MRRLALIALLLLLPTAAWAAPITLWHSYYGAERDALESIVLEWNAAHPEDLVRPESVPYEAYANKLSSAIPRGHGPDLFIFAHERIGDWAASGLIQPLDERLDQGSLGQFIPATVQALRYEDKLYGLPLSSKCVALIRNIALAPNAPQTTDELLAMLAQLKTQQPEIFGLAYEAGSFYHHSGWLHGFGGGAFNERGEIELDSVQNAASLRFLEQLISAGYIPEEPNGTLVAQLFNSGLAAMTINGPWFLGQVEDRELLAVSPLPTVSATGLAAEPYMTVEALLLAAGADDPDAALRFAAFLAGPEGARVRALQGNQLVAYAPLYDDPSVALDPALLGFARQMQQARPMPNSPLMRMVWEPAAQALRQVLRGSATPEQALASAQHLVKIYTREPPPARSPLPYLLVLALLALIGLILLVVRARSSNALSEAMQERSAYGYLLPAAFALLLLVFIPFAVGTAVAFFSHREGAFTFVGLANFTNILSSRDYAISDPLSFYFTLAVTVLWTAANVALHVSIGLGLALLLRDPLLKLRGVYRVLLIIPWAVPNYITALMWKGMFHKQFGAINGILSHFGWEPSWFSHFWTAFAANLCTNTWLGFPFMMVVCLGALESIPRDLEEAAEVDGATKLTRFRHITMPLLRPALVPAIVLGSVWTFNMFNIIYLVSGGEPDGASEILITEAYRWAFDRQVQYGYAAAYATLIFLALLCYGAGTRRVLGRAEG
ncbi:MAG: extracellular solute-binding protein [Candidatus Alcyoniella australis]|nr:extracellular solute-binding protein [Candidatus Alcyoniella australis]